jgi:hypothetical protein
MSYYHIVFVKNRILSCSPSEEKTVSKIPHCEYSNGQLNFAVVRANNESQARSIAKYMALEILKRNRLKH